MPGDTITLCVPFEYIRRKSTTSFATNTWWSHKLVLCAGRCWLTRGKIWWKRNDLSCQYVIWCTDKGINNQQDPFYSIIITSFFFSFSFLWSFCSRSFAEIAALICHTFFYCRKRVKEERSFFFLCFFGNFAENRQEYRIKISTIN